MMMMTNNAKKLHTKICVSYIYTRAPRKPKNGVILFLKVEEEKLWLMSCSSLPSLPSLSPASYVYLPLRNVKRKLYF